MTEIQLQDICRAMDVPSSRISEALAGLGATPGNKGRRRATVNLSDAIRAGAVRGLIVLGLSSNAALEIVRQISRDDIKAVVAHDEPTWLAVCDDPSPSGYAFVLCSPEQMKNVAAGGGAGLRFLDLHSIAKAIIGEALKRNQLMPAAKGARHQTTSPLVSDYVANKGESGIQLHASLRLAIFRDGRGLAFQLTPATARDLAAQLQRVADAAEAPALRPEDVN